MSKTAVYKRIDAIQEAEDKVEGAKKAFLVARGWSETSETPGSFWLWAKRIEVHRRYRNAAQVKVDGKWTKNPEADGWTDKTTAYDALCPLDMAVAIEKAIVASE